MSLILDALKKLDQEKTARKDGVVNVAAEILQPERLQRRNKKRTILLTVAAVGAGLAVFAVLALREGTGVLKQSSPPVPAAPLTVPRAAMPTPLPPAAPPQKPTELSVARPRADIGKGELLPPHAKPVGTSAAPPPAVSRPLPAESAATKEIYSPENSTRGSVPHLQVSGIVWQEERSARRAYVNGIIASEGSVIDGAKVVEIYPARIRFFRGGKSFDVSIEKTP